jgi:ABC-type antimicrobial peptide transport system permease subunit
MGLFLALAGLYAVMAYQVARRTREIGIRMALGAERLQVMKMMLKQAAGIGVTGIILGLVLTYGLRPLLNASAGSKPQPIDPWLYTFVITGLLLTSLLAAAIPVRAATRIDPLLALRQE